MVNWLLDREVEEKEKVGLYMGFVDLKGAFDRVYREFLWREMARIGIDEGLRRAVM